MSFFEFPNTRTYDSDLGWLIRAVRKLIEASASDPEWKSQVRKELDELEKCCNDMMSGNFTPEFSASLVEWMQNNALDIVGELIKMVFFGLEDGYFVAYIPESWSDIIFNTTGLDITILGQDFGHLVLSY